MRIKLKNLYEWHDFYAVRPVRIRDEVVFLELIEKGGDVSASLTSLINIYQQQKDWQQAITTAKKLENLSNIKMNVAIAHYYCELAEKSLSQNNYELLNKFWGSSFL